MSLSELLGVGPGVTAFIGSGGKTTLLSALARELPGTVVLATTTHILPFPGVPLIVSPDAVAVADTLRTSRVVCVGAPSMRDGEKDDKLVAPELGIERLAALADHVLVEADGAHRLPLKAHASWEPVIPAGTRRTVLVVGAGGLGRPVVEAVHRPEEFCRLAGCGPQDAATPELVARVLNAEALADIVLVNQADAPGRERAGRELAALLDAPALVGSLRTGSFASAR